MRRISRVSRSTSTADSGRSDGESNANYIMMSGMTPKIQRRAFIASTSGMALATFMAGTSEAEQIRSSGLTKWLEAQIAQFPAKAGVYIKHLGTGEDGGAHSDDLFNSMSVIKLA